MMRLRVAEGVGVIEEGDAVYAGRLPDGPILAFEGTAGIIWLKALDGPRGDIAERVAEDVDAVAADIRDEVERFVDELIELGLLVPAEAR
ncbi:hypothetical protein GCM10027414_31930 [Humibacter ginsengiterrae]